METPKFEAVEKTRFHDITWVPEISSTNTALLERARNGGREGEIIVADLQTKGRGRRGRTWTAPSGTSLMMSILLRPPKDTLSPSNASLVTSALAVSARAAVDEMTNIKLEVKWPNDLVVDSPNPVLVDGDPGYRKVAGILTETLIQQNAIEALVVGIGLNTGWGQVPPELELVATSLDVLAGVTVDRTQLALTLLEHFETEYAALLEPAGAKNLRQKIRKHSATLGKRILVHTNQEPETQSLQGHALDIDEAGRLVIEFDNGDTQVVAVADVEHLRLDAR
ncbi:MAG: biotin--[acetyl-CoA-carboxylase] ligase [Actinomycetota bacterium]|nr:biotin--[acetyl-CoA-carboxylase] ligase [Actinomycetota bacterium]